MQRQKMMQQGSVTTYDRDGTILSHSESETEITVPLHREPEVFAAFSQALRDGENVLDIAERFGSDHCTVLYWKRRLAFSGQLDIAAGVDQ
jgi:hypothetical protein